MEKESHFIFLKVEKTFVLQCLREKMGSLLTQWLFLLVDVVSSNWLVRFNYSDPPLMERGRKRELGKRNSAV